MVLIVTYVRTVCMQQLKPFLDRVEDDIRRRADLLAYW